MKIEVVVFSVAGALAAQRGGAFRVELCENNAEGGTTPSYGTIELTRKKLDIDLHVMIRPRGGDFLYSDDEYEIMKSDILQCKKLGVDGVVFGTLLPDGNIDIDRCRILSDLAKPMTVNFHRAFDRVSDPFIALEQLIQCGFQRVLTSGQRSTAMEGIDLLTQLVRQAGERISVMPGGGVREENIEELIFKTKAREFHTSARCFMKSGMKFSNPGFISEGTASSGILSTDENIISKFVKKANSVVI